MKGISVNLEDEKAEYFWKDGKVYCTGYDLESEKAALALTSFGTGIGVLLVAMNDSCKSEVELMSEVKKFVTGQKKIVSNKYNNWPSGQLLYEYLSYSPDPLLRWTGMESARLSERHYRRMLKDPEMEIKIRMARLSELPEKYFKQLVPLSNHWINSALAHNQNCPSDVFEILAQDKDLLVRRTVANNPACPVRILEILTQESSSWVRQNVAINPACPERLLEILAKDKEGEVRSATRENLAKSRELVV